MTVRVRVQRYAIPTLWLDTSVVSELVKLEEGRTPEGPLRARLEKLRSLVGELVEARKLICPQGGHREEYVRWKNRESAAMWARLSLGARLESEHTIGESQLFEAMKAHVQGLEEFDLMARLFFNKDPEDALADVDGLGGLVLAVHMDDSAELAALKARGRDGTQNGVEEIRLKSRSAGLTYQQQFERELNGHAKMVSLALAERERFSQDAKAIHPSLGSLGADFFPDHPYMWHWWHSWLSAKGAPSHEAMLEFFRSEHHHTLPSIRIQSALWADLVTGAEEVGPGDSQDITFLSTVLPIAHFVVADARMRERIRHRKLAEDWGTQVFSLRTIDELFAELEQLRA